MEWINCRNKLPRRFKHVLVKTLYGTYEARRSLFGISWVSRSGMTDFICAFDFWKEIEKKETE